MIKYFSILVSLLSLTATAQSLEVGAGAGTGAFYFIEEADNSVVTAFDSPASIYLDIKYNFKERIDGLKLRLQNTSVNIVGEDYQTGAPLDGTVETFTTSILYERLRSDKVFNIGYNVGLGFTQQDFIQIKNRNNAPIEDRFMSISLNGIFSVWLQENLRLNANTGLIWTDPISTFKGAENWQTAGEDISLLAQIGVSYTFKHD